MRYGALFVLVLVVAGCGSQSARELPPPAGAKQLVAPLGDGRVAVLDGRARELVLRDSRGHVLERRSAGLGPTRLACSASQGHCWVLDSLQHAVLVFDLRPHLELARRHYLPSGASPPPILRTR